MIYQLVVVLAIIAAALAQSADVHPRQKYEVAFFDFLQKYEVKIANAKEFIKRLEIFIHNVEKIEAHNADKTQTYQMGINQFSHMTFEEFRDYNHLGSLRPPFLRAKLNLKDLPTDNLPASVDWTTQGAVTPVKNQGQCGSCWSFSATGSLEGAYYIKNKSLLSFSEQELVSCDSTDQGCNGGWMDNAFTWMQNNGGISTEEAYPYTSGTTMQSGTCQKYTNTAKTAPTGFVDVTPNNVQALMAAVAQQPVSIAIQANQPSFQSYKGGVLTGKCGQQLDHGVLAVGYGTLNGVDYWKVKNSWGASSVKLSLSALPSLTREDTTLTPPPPHLSFTLHHKQALAGVMPATSSSSAPTRTCAASSWLPPTPPSRGARWLTSCKKCSRY